MGTQGAVPGGLCTVLLRAAGDVGRWEALNRQGRLSRGCVGRARLTSDRDFWWQMRAAPLKVPAADGVGGPTQNRPLAGFFLLGRNLFLWAARLAHQRR